MKEISKEMALYLYIGGDTEVYRLFFDGSESLITDSNDICDGDFIFGVE